MSKKVGRRKHGPVAGKRNRNKYLGLAAIVLMATVGMGSVLSPLGDSLGTKKLRNLFFSPAPPPPVPPPGSPSKEYIYAGSRLIATEEPAGVTLSAPASLVATTDSNLPVPHVDINWQPTTGAHHYEVERTDKIGTSYQLINGNVTGNSFTDSDVISVKSYIYRVRAVDAVGNVSPFSNIDMATAISFEDNSLQAGATLVKAQHINQLRQAVNAVRAATAGLAPASWAESVSSGVTQIKVDHIQELRTNLDQARSDLGLAACSYSAASAGSPILKDHIDQLRQCVK